MKCLQCTLSNAISKYNCILLYILRGQRTSLVLIQKILIPISLQAYPIQSPVYSCSTAFASSIVVSQWVTAGGWSREMLACVTGQIIKSQTSEVSLVRYPNWFNSMFAFRSKLIQFNIGFKIISWKFNTKDYSI